MPKLFLNEANWRWDKIFIVEAGSKSFFFVAIWVFLCDEEMSNGWPFFFYQMRSKQDNKGSTLTSNASVLRVQMYRTRWAIDRVIRPWPKVNGFRWIFFTLLLSYFTLLITGVLGEVFSLGFSYLKRRPSSTLGKVEKSQHPGVLHPKRTNLAYDTFQYMNGWCLIW